MSHPQQTHPSQDHGRRDGYGQGMVTIPRQFNGPPDSGNGGWVSGLLAQAHLDHGGSSPVSVRLRMPPPLDTELDVAHEDGQTRLVDPAGQAVGTATDGAFGHEAPPFVDAKTVQRGHDAYPGFTIHPFSTCFTCGVGRSAGDGLCIFTGPVGDGLVAGPWHVHESFADEDGTTPLPISWSALDCPGGWAADFTEQAMLLGTMTAEILRRPEAGRTYHAVGRRSGRDGRKFFTATALYAPDGELLGRAEQVWIQIDPATLGS